MSNELKLKKMPEDAAFLRQKSAPVAVHEMREAYELGKQMLAMLDGKTELGLSAIQVGKPWNVIAIKIDKYEKILINAKIAIQSRERNFSIESCLSFDIKKDFYRVKRPSALKVSHRTLNGNIELESFSGLLAVVIQHEIDHTKGKLMSDVGERFELETEQEKIEEPTA